MQNRDLVLGWLNNIHTMEVEISKILDQHINDANNFPDLQKQIKQHRETTMRQTKRVEKVITNLGGTIEEASPETRETIINMENTIPKELNSHKPVKNATYEYALENYEIAQYKVLTEIGRRLNLKDVVRLSDQNINEEEFMASYLKNQIPVLMDKYLIKEDKEQG
jgi:ferritin-like metal-binding protein YciE